MVAGKSSKKDVSKINIKGKDDPANITVGATIEMQINIEIAEDKANDTFFSVTFLDKTYDLGSVNQWKIAKTSKPTAQDTLPSAFPSPGNSTARSLLSFSSRHSNEHVASLPDASINRKPGEGLLVHGKVAGVRFDPNIPQNSSKVGFIPLGIHGNHEAEHVGIDGNGYCKDLCAYINGKCSLKFQNLNFTPEYCLWFSTKKLTVAAWRKAESTSKPKHIQRKKENSAGKLRRNHKIDETNQRILGSTPKKGEKRRGAQNTPSQSALYLTLLPSRLLLLSCAGQINLSEAQEQYMKTLPGVSSFQVVLYVNRPLLSPGLMRGLLPVRITIRGAYGIPKENKTANLKPVEKAVPMEGWESTNRDENENAEPQKDGTGGGGDTISSPSGFEKKERQLGNGIKRRNVEKRNGADSRQFDYSQNRTKSSHKNHIEKDGDDVIEHRNSGSSKSVINSTFSSATVGDFSQTLWGIFELMSAQAFLISGPLQTSSRPLRPRLGNHRLESSLTCAKRFSKGKESNEPELRKKFETANHFSILEKGITTQQSRDMPLGFPSDGRSEAVSVEWDEDFVIFWGPLVINPTALRDFIEEGRVNILLMADAEEGRAWQQEQHMPPLQLDNSFSERNIKQGIENMSHMSIFSSQTPPFIKQNSGIEDNWTISSSVKTREDKKKVADGDAHASGQMHQNAPSKQESSQVVRNRRGCCRGVAHMRLTQLLQCRTTNIHAFADLYFPPTEQAEGLSQEEGVTHEAGVDKIGTNLRRLLRSDQQICIRPTSALPMLDICTMGPRLKVIFNLALPLFFPETKTQIPRPIEVYAGERTQDFFVPEILTSVNQPFNRIFFHYSSTLRRLTCIIKSFFPTKQAVFTPNDLKKEPLMTRNLFTSKEDKSNISNDYLSGFLIEDIQHVYGVIEGLCGSILTSVANSIRKIIGIEDENGGLLYNSSLAFTHRLYNWSTYLEINHLDQSTFIHVKLPQTLNSIWICTTATDNGMHAFSAAATCIATLIQAQSFKHAIHLKFLNLYPSPKGIWCLYQYSQVSAAEQIHDHK